MRRQGSNASTHIHMVRTSYHKALCLLSEATPRRLSRGNCFLPRPPPANRGATRMWGHRHLVLACGVAKTLQLILVLDGTGMSASAPHSHVHECLRLSMCLFLYFYQNPTRKKIKKYRLIGRLGHVSASFNSLLTVLHTNLSLSLSRVSEGEGMLFWWFFSFERGGF